MITGEVERIAWNALLATQGQPITYFDGTRTVEIAEAVLTRPRDLQQSAEESIVLNSKNWDWLIAAVDLVDELGNAIVPAIGHEITATTDGTKYRLQPGDANNNAWRWMTPAKFARRITTEER